MVSYLSSRLLHPLCLFCIAYIYCSFALGTQHQAPLVSEPGDYQWIQGSITDDRGDNSFVQPNWQKASDIRYAPARGPAIPLAVKSPYTHAWITTANNGSLNSNSAMFWDGSPLGWQGFVMVDDVAYEWMGIGSRSLPSLTLLKSAIPISVRYDSQFSNFTFEAGPVELVASFFSPVLPMDLCRTSIPLSYLTLQIRSMDGDHHSVTTYIDVNGAWVSQPAAPLVWELYEDGHRVGSLKSLSRTGLLSWVVQLRDQYKFGESRGQARAQNEQGVFPQWGKFVFSSSQGQAQSMRFQAGHSIDQRFGFITGKHLTGSVDRNYRSYEQQEPVFAFEHALGDVGKTESISIVFTIGHVVDPAIKLLSTAGLEHLPPWWQTCYGGFSDMLLFHWNDLSRVQKLAHAMEGKLKHDINQYYVKAAQSEASTTRSERRQHDSNTGRIMTNSIPQFDSSNAYGYLLPSNGCNSTGVAIPDAPEADAYYSIVALAARQIMAAYVLTKPSITASNQSEPFAFQKEIASNGNINTVDVAFPSMPFFVWSNPDLLRLTLEPLLLNQENGFYPNNYPMHDLGTHFPNATGHVEGDDEYMPVEEAGNMILMLYAVHKFTTNSSYLQTHYRLLLQWAEYLIEYSLVPAVQLSSDDFAGIIANQTNLAIKGIVGLAAMAEISTALSDHANANRFDQLAQDYYRRWTSMAIDPSNHHALLSYQFRSSWGLLYNLYPAKLLNLSIIPQSLYDMQSDFYPTVSQIWGVPLDSRHDWTKSDWSLWTAAYCKPKTRALFVNALAYWLNTTSAGSPFPDLYQTNGRGEVPYDPYLIQFLARPVQGGLYSLLALTAHVAE